MYEFFTRHALYVVLVIALIVWLGIAWYLNRLEKRLSLLERRLPEDQNNSTVL